MVKTMLKKRKDDEERTILSRKANISEEETGSSSSSNEDSEQEAEEQEDEELEVEDEGENTQLVGFADAMSKVLGQNVADKVPILAKRTTKFMKEISNSKSEIKQKKMSFKEKKLKDEKNMIIPDHTNIESERKLKKIATKGVVALFNAITKHQKVEISTANNKVNKIKVKELSKDNFLGLLKKSNERAQTENKDEDEKPKSWSVLQDDYMMSATKLKDWDKDDSDEENGSESEMWNDAIDSEGSDAEQDRSSKRKASSSSSKPSKRRK